MSERKARWAMWSIGNIANRVIVELRESEVYDIAAVISSNKDKAQKFIDDNGLKEAVAYDNIEDVLKRDDIDIVYIASPPWLHKEQCCQVMNAGKGVLVEKPMVLCAQDAKDIFACAEKNNVFCAEGVWSNYFPNMKKMHEWIDTGRIGEPVEVISTFGFPMVELGMDRRNIDMSRWGNRLSAGGGTLLQFGCYCVNFALNVFKTAPEKIVGITERIDCKDGPDQNTAVILTWDGGKKRAMLSCSFDARTVSESRVSGTKGEITVGTPFFAGFDAKLFTQKSPFGPDGLHWWTDLEESFHDDYKAKMREGFKYQFEAVSQYVLDGKTESPEVSHQYSIDLATTIERIRKEIGLWDEE